MEGSSSHVSRQEAGRALPQQFLLPFWGKTWDQNDPACWHSLGTLLPSPSTVLGQNWVC